MPLTLRQLDDGECRNGLSMSRENGGGRPLRRGRERSAHTARRAEGKTRVHLAIRLLLPQANDTSAVSAHKVARGLQVRLQELERRYVALVTWQSSVYTSRTFILLG